MVTRGVWTGLATVALVGACGSNVTIDGTTTSSTSTTQSTTVGSSSSASTGAGGNACCADTEVLRGHNCIPTTELGCGASCGDGSCPAGWRCDECAAVGPCGEELCQPACVLEETGPNSGLESGYLRIAPSRIDAGQPTAVGIVGAPLYVGALWYSVRVGTESEHLLQGGLTGGPCEQSFESDPLAVGTYPVWVSQYGGGDPWVLAGILTVGEPAPSCTQPGYPCIGSSECCQASGVTMECEQGHCSLSN